MRPATAKKHKSRNPRSGPETVTDDWFLLTRAERLAPLRSRSDLAAARRKMTHGRPQGQAAVSADGGRARPVLSSPPARERPRLCPERQVPIARRREDSIAIQVAPAIAI